MPIVECLERRLFLTAVVVNSATDTHVSGLIDLRDAISTANSSTTPTTITFSSTVFATAKTITLNGTELELSNTAHVINITGPSAGVTISGNNASRVFLIDAGVTVNMSAITITKGFLK